MAYGLTYRMQFTDRKGLPWRMDLLLKDGPQLSSPIIIPNISAEPLRIEYGKDEDLTAPIIESKAFITYIVDGVAPAAETFINIDEDTWLVEIYQGVVPALYWKGFIKPDNNRYPWLYPPYEFTINAVDFTFSKAVPMNLNDGAGLLLYDHISFSQVLARTLFQSIGYTDVILKILYSLKPAVLLADPITTSLLFHTDAFYTLENGPDLSFDALTKLMLSLRARMFYAGGSYWIQRLAEIGGATQDITTITPDDLAGIEASYPGSRRILGATPLSDIYYLDRSQELSVNASIKQQEANYQLKAINQIKNFDWRTDTQSPFTDWEGDTTGFFQRIGTGGYQDLYKLHIIPPPPATTRQIWTRLSAVTGQVFELNLRADALNAKYLQVFVYLVDAGGITGLQRMDEGGNWTPAAGNSTDAIQLSVENKSSNGTLQAVSSRIPEIAGHPNLEVLFLIGHVIPVDVVPPGQDVYVNLYPVFGRLFVNNYSDIQTKIASIKTYSYIPDREDLFFMDTTDATLSNTIYYNNGSTIVPIPNNDWDGRPIEENTARFILDTYYIPSYTFEGTVFSNTLQFNNSIQLADFSDKIMIQIRDKYSVRACTHELLLTEFKFPDSGSGAFTELPITRQR